MNENVRFVPDHVDDHVNHLFLLVRNLIEIEGRQVKFIIGLKDVFERRKRVDDMPVIVLAVFINFHTRRAATHDFFLLFLF